MIGKIIMYVNEKYLIKRENHEKSIITPNLPPAYFFPELPITL